MAIGGMYNVLELAIGLVKDTPEALFTKEDIRLLTGLSDQAVTSNICRLVRSGFLVVVPPEKNGVKGGVNRYRLNVGDLNDFLDSYFR